MTMNQRRSGAQLDATAVLERYLKALTGGDLAMIRQSFADDATWTLHGELPLAGTKRGRAAIMAFLIDAGGLFVPETQRFAFGDITAQGNRAVLEWHVHGIAAATGLEYDNRYCGVFVVCNGVIVEVREYLDSLHAAQVLFGSAS